MKLEGSETMRVSELNFELQRGARFVYFESCLLIRIVTFRRPSAVYSIRPGENDFARPLRFAVVSVPHGWRGIRFTRGG